MTLKISKIITGSPVVPINIGERALIRMTDGLCRTTPVVDVRRVSASEIRFETRNTKYVLRVVPVRDQKKGGKPDMKFPIKPCYKLTWPEVGKIMTEEVSAILGRNISCHARSEDINYWGCNFADPISLTELCMILQNVHATKEEWTDALPDEGDTVIHDMGWELGEKLLRRNLIISWGCRYIADDSLWLLDVQDAPAPETETADIGGTKVCFADLKSKDELFNFFEEGACDHATLMEFCEDYKKKYSNDLCWPYPLGVDNHLGLMLVLVKEGVLALPYDGFDAGNYEFFTQKDAHLLTSDEITDLGDHWERFSDNLLCAVSDMAIYLQKEERRG